MRFVDAFPLTPTEKIQKVKLREWIATELADARHHRSAEAHACEPRHASDPPSMR